MKKYSSTMRESSRRTSRHKRIWIAFGICAVGILLVTFLPRLIGGLSSYVFLPVTSFESWIHNTGSSLPSYFVDRAALDAQIDELQQQLNKVGGDQYTLRMLEKENSRLRALLGDSGEERIGAGVIGRPTVTPYDVLIIDKGSRDGIKEYAPVYISDEQVIGMVARTFNDTSVVVLATTPDFESTVYIFGPNIYTNARGLGGGIMEVSVPQGIPLMPGDLVVVPSFGSGVYGSISVVDSIPSEPEQRGYVSLTVPLQGIRFVSVGVTPQSQLTFEEAVEVVKAFHEDITRVPVPEGVLVEVDATSTASTTADVDTGDEE